MFHVPLITSAPFPSLDIFWDSILVYYNKPHLVNRRILGVSEALFCKVEFNSKDVKHIAELFQRPSILSEMRKLKKLSKENITEDFLKNFLDCYDKNVKIHKSAQEEFHTAYCGKFISVRILIPRHTNKFKDSIEIVLLDKNENSIIFHAVTDSQESLPLAPTFPYELKMTSSEFKINLSSFQDADTPGAEWLADKLYSKIVKWSQNETKNGKTSLSGVDVDFYSVTYRRIKEKYFCDLNRDWFKITRTDPQKYIFEDFAIASYLISYWTKHGFEDINFVDCGCGNGLLVYVLNQEGYKGCGIDIQKRPIWDIYPKNINLQVGTVTPETVFPESTWIIGNHSDELTPWIPVIALKSLTNYFVLPCCPYDFDGRKYMRKNTSESVYSDYMKYIKTISEKCDFVTTIDRLRIPSTKRTCLIGVKSSIGEDKRRQLIAEIDEMIQRKFPTYTVRNINEKPRNCTQLEKELVQSIILSCVNFLLSKKNLIRKFDGSRWNAGSTVHLSELVKLISPSDLRKLKSEHGGLQTLLKNHRYIFEVVGGSVKLRCPLKKCDETKKYENKPCWFHRNHPDGCLYSSIECACFH